MNFWFKFHQVHLETIEFETSFLPELPRFKELVTKLPRISFSAKIK